MKCFMCSASIPDGVSTCPECGARIVSGGAKESEQSWKELVKSSKMDGDEKAFLSRAYGPLYNLKICKTVSAVLALIALGVLFYLVIVISGAVNGYGYGVDGATSFFKVFSTIATIIEAIIFVFILINFMHLSEYEERFETVFRFAIAALVIGVITQFISNEVAALFMKIVKAVIEIIYMYHYYGAMADITCPFSDSISDRWDLIFKIYVASIVITVILAIYAAIALNALNLVAYMVSLLIIAIIEFVLIILELVYLKKTVDLFETLE
ncbi:MAG: hypothetical protein J5372_08995 [Lachnospiraceae bacterium]|nr:hypothetical protein [Lachnospiraceae bacterium]